MKPGYELLMTLHGDDYTRLFNENQKDLLVLSKPTGYTGWVYAGIRGEGDFIYGRFHLKEVTKYLYKINPETGEAESDYPVDPEVAKRYRMDEHKKALYGRGLEFYIWHVGEVQFYEEPIHYMNFALHSKQALKHPLLDLFEDPIFVDSIGYAYKLRGMPVSWKKVRYIGDRVAYGVYYL